VFNKGGAVVVAAKALNAVWAVWALAAGALRSRFARSPERLELVAAVGGLGIAVVGLGFLVSGRKD
jgi:hypothetical protein